MSIKPKIIIICGPTASGKSELAVKLAKKFEGEIISADSRQVYKSLDIGTGKIPGKWLKKLKTQNSKLKDTGQNSKLFRYKGVIHHCIDFVPLRKTFAVAEFQDCARKAIENITAREKIPIIAGGTGFWVDSAVYQINLPQVPPDEKLRRNLEKKTLPQLVSLLKKMDPKRAENIELQNPRRLIRAIEVAKALGNVPRIERKNPYAPLWIGLNPQNLKNRIEKRVKRMIEKGLLPETKKLFKKISKNRINQLGFEYKLAAMALKKEISKKEMEFRLIKANTRYARRQMRWFKRNENIHWVKTDKEAEKLVRKFLI